MAQLTAEHLRLTAHREYRANWRLWGPYLSERAWGTVREDYSELGEAWSQFPHDHARSRAYRWNEDGLAGISDRNQYLCLSLALWNERDAILKERLFGLTGNEGNHGEDVKEAYFYLDNTPTHSYMRMLYKYPHKAYPYTDLVHENGRRGFYDFEYEVLDTGVFDEDRYFDVFVEYAKAAQDDILMRISVSNRGPDPAVCHLLPTLWFRNTWSWGYDDGPMHDVPAKPVLEAIAQADGALAVAARTSATLGDYMLYAEGADGFLFTENETNFERLYGVQNRTPYVKDAFHRYLVHGETEAVSPDLRGTKAAAHYRVHLGPGESRTLQLRLRAQTYGHEPPFDSSFDAAFDARKQEADAFFAAVQAPDLDPDDVRIQRQALAGMLWSKQMYYIDMPQWLHGDPASAPPARRLVRNGDWEHMQNFDIISMPDKWEYPWYATWDLAFHCVPLAMMDPDYAKRQLELFTREWYIHPNGALPAYEWNFGDVNPPVHAWATWRVYQIDAARQGKADRAFLEGIFHKLLLNFTWWVNRKDEDGHNVFQGGFLGLDNISVFDRSADLPTGGHIDQSDGTAWMAFFSSTMLRIALELAKENPVYQDSATKFFEHFLRIADAMSDCGGRGHALWNPDDGFYYDALHLPDDRVMPLKVRSLVGLMPLIVGEIIEPDLLDALPDFKRRMGWFLRYRSRFADNLAQREVPGQGERYLAALLTRDRLQRILEYLFDEEEFLGDYGIRSLSKFHLHHPYHIEVHGQSFDVTYWPAESRNGLYGGNSNWRGPIWFPINYLVIEGLRNFHRYYGDDFKVEVPTGSGIFVTLAAAADNLAERLVNIFRRNAEGRRPVFGGQELHQTDPHWRDHVLFYEYFHGDSGAGLGASHQTGWTGLVADLIQQTANHSDAGRT